MFGALSCHGRQQGRRTTCEVSPKMALLCRSGEFGIVRVFFMDFERYGTTGKYVKLGGDSCVEVWKMKAFRTRGDKRCSWSRGLAG